MKGTTNECLADYFRRFPNDMSLGVFAKVSNQSLLQWRRQKNKPNGEALVRVRFFLKLAGYEPVEVAKLHPAVEKLGQLIFLDLVEVGEIASVLKISAHDQSDIYRYLRGEVVPSGGRLSRMESINATFDVARVAKLERVSAEIRAKYHVSTEPGHASGGVGSADLISDFARACERVKELGGKLLAGPKDQRVVMRKKIGAGREPLLHLTWETLNNLLSEKME